MSDAPDELQGKARGDVATVVKGGAVQIAGQITQRSLSFFFGAVFVRLLGAGGYGLYRQVAQILGNLAQVGLAGFNYAAMRFISRARATGDASGVKGAARVGITGALVASSVVVVATILFAGPIADLFTEGDTERDELIDLLRAGAAYIPLFALLQVLRYCTQAYKTMVPSVVAGNIVQPVIRFIAGVILLLAGFEVMGAVVSLTLSVGVAAVLAGYYFLRMMTPEQRAAAPKAPVGEMIRFSLPQGGSSLLGIQALGLGILILGIVAEDRAVGLFAIALSLQGPGNVFLGGIVNIWAPVVSDLHGRGEIERLGSLYKTINRWIATFSYPVFVALLLEPDLFVKFYGPKAAGAETAVMILALGNLFYTGTGPTGYVISMTGHPAVNLANSILGVALYLGLGFWIVPEHGIVGMAWVDSGVTAFINSLRVIEAKILVGIQPFGRSFLKPVIASLAGGAVLLAWRLIPGSGVALDIAGLVAGALAYIATLKALGLDSEEAYVLDRIKKRAFKGRGRRGDGGGKGTDE